MAGRTKVAWSPTIPDSCPAGWAAAIASIHPTFLPDGLALSEPRSVRADSIPGSERHDAHCRASAGRGSVPRRPGSGESHHHSAELRSMRDQPPAPARTTDRHIALPPLLQAADPSFPPIIPINPITLDYSSLLCGWGGLRPFLLKKQSCLHGRSDHGGSLSKRGRLPTFPLSQYHRRSEV